MSLTKQDKNVLLQTAQELAEYIDKMYTFPRLFSIITRSYVNFFIIVWSVNIYWLFRQPKVTYGMKECSLYKNRTPCMGDIERLKIFNGKFIPLVDLGAFCLDLFRRDHLKIYELKHHKVKTIVLMEDRNPLFFFNYTKYQPNKEVPLNKHKYLLEKHKNEVWRQKDMKALVKKLQKNGIKVILGAWAHCSHLPNTFVRNHIKDIHPVFPGSDDLNPLGAITQNGQKVPFVEIVCEQYRKLQKDFGFDGLFLGDGFMGYRSFLHPDGPFDFSFTKDAWNIFYKTLKKEVHKTNGTLFAYDIMGYCYKDMRKAGVEMGELIEHLDYLVFQSYGQVAWNYYMHHHSYTAMRDIDALASFPKKCKSKLLYTLEIGDTVEKWRGTPEQLYNEKKSLDPLASGSVGVWSNEIIREMLGTM